MVIETFDQSDEETWLYDFEHFEHFDYIETNFDYLDNFDNWIDSPVETCDIWDIDYNSDNWIIEFRIIFVTW